MLLRLIVGAINEAIASQELRINEQNEVQQKLLTEQNEIKAQKIEQERINNQIAAKKRVFRNNWANYIIIGRSQYLYSEPGGIDAFDVYVKNNSEYILDEVKVSIDYIKAAGGIYKTETIVIGNILPNSEKSGRAPSSSRGTSIYSEISGVISKQLNLCFPRDNGNSSDPYYCD